MKKVNVSVFLKELFKRFALPSPKFFQVVQAIGVACAVIGIIPQLLVEFQITPGPIFSKYLQLALVVTGIVTKLLAKLPVENSTIISKTTNKLPFTTIVKAESKLQQP